MKSLDYILSISLGLLILIGLEGILTAGHAYNFNSYGLIAWISQILAIIIVVILAIIIVKNDYDNN